MRENGLRGGAMAIEITICVIAFAAVFIVVVAVSDRMDKRDRARKEQRGIDQQRREFFDEIERKRAAMPHEETEPHDDGGD